MQERVRMREDHRKGGLDINEGRRGIHGPWGDDHDGELECQRFNDNDRTRVWHMCNITYMDRLRTKDIDNGRQEGNTW